MPVVHCRHRTASHETKPQATSTIGGKTKPSLFEGKVFKSINKVCSGMCMDQPYDDISVLSLMSYLYSFPIHTLTDGVNTYALFIEYNEGTYSLFALTSNSSMYESLDVGSNENENNNTADLAGQEAHHCKKEEAASIPCLSRSFRLGHKVNILCPLGLQRKVPFLPQKLALRLNPCYPHKQ